MKARFADGSTKTSEFTTRVDADRQTLQYAARNIGVVGKATAIAPTTNAPETGTTYALVCGEVPAGTRFDSATGLITGRPTRPVLLPTPLRVAETSPTGRAAASFIYVVTRTGASSFSYPAHPPACRKACRHSADDHRSARFRHLPDVEGQAAQGPAPQQQNRRHYGEGAACEQASHDHDRGGHDGRRTHHRSADEDHDAALAAPVEICCAPVGIRGRSDGRECALRQ